MKQRWSNGAFTVHVFCDQQTARAWTTVLLAKTAAPEDRPPTISTEPGATIVWDGKPCTIVYHGQTTSTLLTEDRRRLELANTDFQALVCGGKVQGQCSPSPEQDGFRVQVRKRLLSARPRDLAKANWRYAIIQPALQDQHLQATTTSVRTIRFWLARYREAAKLLGCGYIGLLLRRAHPFNCWQQLLTTHLALLTT